MSIDESLVGRTYPATETYTVGRESIRDFALAVKATHPAHTDVEAARALGYPDVVAPPTYAIIAAQRAESRLVLDKSAGVDFSRVVHAEQKFQLERPIVAGDELSVELVVDSVRTMGAGAMLTTQAIITDAEGQRVGVTTSSLLVRAEEG
jgi:acyl dehydratase